MADQIGITTLRVVSDDAIGFIVNGNSQDGMQLNRRYYPELVEFLLNDELSREQMSSALNRVYQLGRADAKRDIREALGVQ